MIQFTSNTLKSIIALTLITVIASPRSIKAQSLSDNWAVAIWQRLTSRPPRDQRPSTIHKGGGNRDLCP